MLETTIQTGIYKHFKRGDLYFVEKTFTFKQSGKEDIPSIYYYPLYEVSDGYGRSISEFSGSVDSVSISDGFFGGEVERKTAKRFELIRELDLKFLNVLLPGNTIKEVGERYSLGMVFSSRFDDKEGKIFVRFSRSRSPITEIELNDFLTKFVRF